MKPLLRILSVFSIVLLLSGCGGEDNKDLPIFGVWEITQNSTTTYYVFTSTNFVVHGYMAEFECYTKRAVEFDSIDETSITNEGEVKNYEITGDTLTIDSNAVFTRTQNIPEFTSCIDSTVEGTIKVAVEFKDLPETFEILSTSSDFTSSFDLNISFNLDTTASNDRELYFYAEYTYSGTQSRNSINMSELDSRALYYSGGDRDQFVEVIALDVDNNTITLSVDRRLHPLFTEVTSSTPIKVSTSYLNTLAEWQYDDYPSAGFTDGIVLDNAQDAIDDTYGNYSTSTIVDIKSITVTVTE